MPVVADSGAGTAAKFADGTEQAPAAVTATGADGKAGTRLAAEPKVSAAAAASATATDGGAETRSVAVMEMPAAATAAAAGVKKAAVAALPPAVVSAPLLESAGGYIPHEILMTVEEDR